MIDMIVAYFILFPSFLMITRLQRHGWMHLLDQLLRQGELTCGATWHAAGLVTRFHGGNNFRLWHDEDLPGDVL